MHSLKAIIKLGSCHCAYYSGLLNFYLRRTLNRKNQFPAVIINYHSFVTDMSRSIEMESSVVHCFDNFKKEMRWLKKYFDIASLDTVVDTLKSGKKFLKPTVTITIDDGFRDNYDLLFPFLKEERIPVTIFLTTDFIGTSERIWVDKLAETFFQTSQKYLQTQGTIGQSTFVLNSLAAKRRAYNSVSSRLKDIDTPERDTALRDIEKKLGKIENGKPIMLNWDQAREMRKSQVSFGAHTCTHPILTNIPLEEAKREIAESKRKIEQELGMKVRHFAYTNGRPQDFNEELRNFCKEIGFESIATCDNGCNDKPIDVWALKRLGSYVPVSHYALNVARHFLTYEK